LRTLTLAEPAGPVADPTRAEPPASAALAAALPRVLERLRAAKHDSDVDDALILFVDTVAGANAWTRSAPAFKRMARDNAMTLLAQAKFEPVRAPIAYADVQSIALPVLLVGGERTPAPYPLTLSTLERALAEVRRVLIPRAGHAMTVENAPAFNRELLAFLDENRG
jgi:pimeloyl-ACP methyl ester carboxylesterase